MTIKVGEQLPPAPPSLTEEKPDAQASFNTSGKIVVVGVPGAYTPPCSSHVPSYIKTYLDLLNKGVQDIYIIGVNDQFVMNAWRNHLISEHSTAGAELKQLHFLADRNAEFVKSLGLAFDASGLLGGYRSQRFALVVENGIVKDVRVEDEPPNLTVTLADQVLKSL
ncbi:Redoxin [Kalaharituber pfeilii]|nr:Redoxin [Kalaharituber pfeilii]